jgi:hypothetical protein
MAARILEAHAALKPAPGSAEGGVFRPGDVAVLTASASAEDGAVAWPTRDELSAALGKSAVVLDDGTDVQAVDLVAGAGGAASARAWTVQLLLAPGSRELPAIPLRVTGPDGTELATGATPAIDVTVGTVLEAPEAESIDATAQAQDPAALREEVAKHLAPARGPWRLRGDFPLALLLAILGALVLAALLFLWLRRRARRPKPARPVPLDPPEVVALRRIAALRSSGLLARGESLAFHVEIADILKEYLERRTGVELRERTTDEIRALVHPRRGVGAVPLVKEPAVRADVLHVLGATDLVKFARETPPTAESFALADAIERIVDRTTPRASSDAEAPPAEPLRPTGTGPA